MRSLTKITVGLAILGIAMTSLADSVGAGDPVRSVIDNQALYNVTGVAALNQAAGYENAQVNGAAFAIVQSGAALASVSAVQHISTSSLEDPTEATAIIADEAVSESAGLQQINIVAGNSNLQANLVAFAVGGIAIADIVLSQTRGDGVLSSGTSGDGDANRVVVEDRALRNLDGVTQVSVIAGSRNVSANVVGLSVSAGVSL